MGTEHKSQVIRQDHATRTIYPVWVQPTAPATVEGVAWLDTSATQAAGSYAEISVYDSASGATAIAASGIANKVQYLFFDTNGPSNGATPDHTNDHITIATAGVYRLHCEITGDSSGGAGAEFGFGLYKNNGDTLFENCHKHRDFAGGGGEAGSVSLGGLVTLAVSDTIELWIWNETNTDDIALTDVTLNVEGIV